MSQIYPSGDHQVTPNLGLGLWGTDEVTSDNMILIDTAFGSVGGSIQVNGSVVSAPNFVNNSSILFSVTGNNISAGGAVTYTTINGIPGVLITNATGRQMLFMANPAAGNFDPNSTWLWFGANIASASLSGFNYDMVIDDSGNPIGQRNIKLQAIDNVQLQSSTGASSVFFEGGANQPNGGCHTLGNLEISAPNTSIKSGLPGFVDTFILGAPHSPTSASTAGKQGEFAYDGTNLYFCTVTGLAGAATWKFISSGTTAAWSALTGTLSNGQVIPYGDAGISRLGAASLAVGNGTAGDFTGSLKTNIVNAVTGFEINGGATSGNVLRGNGTNFVNAQLQYSDIGGSLPLTLETNGTSNGSQTLLNLVNGTNVTITQDGAGNVTINSSGGGGSTAWSALTSASGNLTLSNAGFTTEFDQTSAVAWLWKNTTVATAITTNASPLLEVAANYWTGAASAQDAWTISSALAAGTNSASTLTFAHTGSSGGLAITTPTGTKLTAHIFQCDNSSGAVSTNFIGLGSSNAAYLTADTTRLGWAWNGVANSTFYGQSVFGWYTGTAGASAIDTGVSRLDAASLAIGNGTAGDFSGALKLTTITLQGKIGTYNGVTTVANGTPSELANLNLTAQATSIGSSTLYAVPASGAGMYRINYYLDVSTAGVGGTLTATFGWTDANSTESITSASVSLGGVTGDFTQGVITFYSKASVNITYLTTFTVGTGSPQYELRAVLEYLG